MRVLHVVTAFPTSSRDVITPWLVDLLQRLRAAGHEVEVFTAAYRGSGDQDFAGIPVHRFRYFFRRWEALTHEEAATERMRRSIVYRLLAPFFVMAGMVAIWRLCRKCRYDVLHVHWPFPLALWGWAGQRARPTPLVATFYGAELRLLRGSLPFLKPLLARAIRRADRVVAISSYTAQQVRDIADVDVSVIPYTTNLTPAAAAPTGPAPRAGTFTVLFVGRLVERKGVVHLIEAMRQPPLGPNARLVVVGEGPERSRLAERIRALGLEDNVILRGQIPEAALQEAYAAAHAFVLPAIIDRRGDTEGLGVVLLEAMNHGVPVIASRVGGIADIVEDEVSGLLVPPGDAVALARALGRLRDDPALAHRLGEAGRRRLAEQFSWETIVRCWERVYAAATSRLPGSARR